MKIQIKKGYSTLAKLGYTLGTLAASLFVTVAAYADPLVMTGTSSGLSTIASNVSQGMTSLLTPIAVISVILGTGFIGSGLFQLHKHVSAGPQAQSSISGPATKIIVGSILLCTFLVTGILDETTFGSNAGTDSNVNYIENHINNTQGGKL